MVREETHSVSDGPQEGAVARWWGERSGEGASVAFQRPFWVLLQPLTRDNLPSFSQTRGPQGQRVTSTLDPVPQDSFRKPSQAPTASRVLGLLPPQTDGSPVSTSALSCPAPATGGGAGPLPPWQAPASLFKRSEFSKANCWVF